MEPQLYAFPLKPFNTVLQALISGAHNEKGENRRTRNSENHQKKHPKYFLDYDSMYYGCID